MENAINVSLSPIQVLLSFLFQIWIVVFPIILIRKLNYLTALLQSQNREYQGDGQSDHDNS
ncbi:MAG TPA: hypothetical protein DD723_04050 [Candidatus Omnitrophica bacterium]|nr:MAG: hypothetical protein A2Z81_00250 [Omnitrophica WOR_2 bacterium GWA2_45_18]OGX19623.1 MAG: hypothetical protein A2Y04_02795 [Omnitrophica WOR_2 bacterium GWC2_45_7]HBR14703.1 hypothetical protein [Candidatus Omnitrophota bacterium]